MNSSMSPTAATVASPPSFQSISSSNLNTNTKPLTQEPYDLLCVGFGPASLAIAVALHDLEINARVLFIERQPQFAWHSGMLLPTARMQISFLKDLATFRDPRSRFTFLNYLKEKDRLEAFTNLSTFLPFREEFNDYLTWAASHFDEYVRYSTEVVAIVPASEGGNPVQTWNVISRDTQTHDTLSFSAKNVIIAVGGQPKLPRVLQGIGENVVHSSQYLRAVPHKLPLSKPNARVAVVGGGQSAAEIFDDLTSRFPQLNTTLYTTQFALKPSDDSPL